MHNKAQRPGFSLSFSLSLLVAHSRAIGCDKNGATTAAIVRNALGFGAWLGPIARISGTQCRWLVLGTGCREINASAPVAGKAVETVLANFASGALIDVLPQQRLVFG
jgi:hypothetical protein